jgi:hypothetical protein
MGVGTGWQAQPKKPWTPRTIEVDHWEPLLVCGDRALAGVTDGSSGIGICTILDTVTGQIIATTEPAPVTTKPSPDVASSWSAAKVMARSPARSTTAKAALCRAGRVTA